MQRDLDFQTVGDARRELAKLQRGYTSRGNWDLAQTCDHLTWFIEGSLDGHQFKVPWLLKFLFGRMVLKRILSRRKMKSGAFTPQKVLPAPGREAGPSVARLQQALERLEKHDGEFHESPFFGPMTPDQCRELHLIHCAHHFGYLEPQ